MIGDNIIVVMRMKKEMKQSRVQFHLLYYIFLGRYVNGLQT